MAKIETGERVSLKGKAPALRSRKERPLAVSRIPAGFPSPAEDFSDGSLDLHEFLVESPPSTFFLRVEGDSMRDAGIFEGDILVVDRGRKAVHGSTVVAVVFGEMTVKRLNLSHGSILEPANSKYRAIDMATDEDASIWGVVVGVARKF